MISALQLVVKYRLNVEHGQVPFQLTEAGYFAFGILKDPWLWLAGSMLVVSALMWYSAISEFHWALLSLLPLFYINYKIHRD